MANNLDSQGSDEKERTGCNRVFATRNRKAEEVLFKMCIQNQRYSHVFNPHFAPILSSNPTSSLENSSHQESQLSKTPKENYLDGPLLARRPAAQHPLHLPSSSSGKSNHEHPHPSLRNGKHNHYHLNPNIFLRSSLLQKSYPQFRTQLQSIITKLFTSSIIIIRQKGSVQAHGFVNPEREKQK
jgi:hypothetical protein